MRPIDLPDPASHPHGTRARYVAMKCRCDACRAANTQFARDCAARAKARARQAATGEVAAPAPQIWTAPDGTKKVRVYKRLCAGINGKPCPTKSHLRKDSTGDICGKCRIGLAYAGLVSSDRAREHLEKLAALGVGKQAVQDACDVSGAMLHEIRKGRYPRIRVETEARILAVDQQAIADHAIVDGQRTHRAIDQMLQLGLTKMEIAQRLGFSAPALQIRPRVLVRTEARVLRLLAEVRREIDAQVDGRRTYGAIETMLQLGLTKSEIAERLGKRNLAKELKPRVPAQIEDRVLRLLDEVRCEVAESKEAPKICSSCGLSHARSSRLRVIGRMLPAKFAEVTAAWPCLYENTDAGQRRFYRDCNVITSENQRRTSWTP